MTPMSDKSKREYTLLKSQVYRLAPRAKRKAILIEYCTVTGHKPSYARKLLNGNRKYRVRKARGNTYTAEARQALIDVWNSIGCPCPEYLQVQIADYAQSYSEHVAYIKPETLKELLKMSASTMTRILKKLPRKKLGYTKANKRSGKNINNPIKAMTPCRSGETIMASKVNPGDMQMDTFALGGGNPCDNFFWVLTGTDRKLQWTVLAPTWNRGQNATVQALASIFAAVPFPITSLHSDNGSEFLNYHMDAFLKSLKTPPEFSRSRPRHSNDNAHVEQKNRSVGRQLFGEMRLDCRDLQNLLEKLCFEWSIFTNFFVPCKMLISKEKRANGKGFRCRYDKPQTPFVRLLKEHILTPEKEARLHQLKAKYSSTELYHSIAKLLKKIVRIQKAYDAAKSRVEVSSFANRSASTLRVAPAGTAPLLREGAPTPLTPTYTNP